MFNYPEWKVCNFHYFDMDGVKSSIIQNGRCEIFTFLAWKL